MEVDPIPPVTSLGSAVRCLCAAGPPSLFAGESGAADAVAAAVAALVASRLALRQEDAMAVWTACCELWVSSGQPLAQERCRSFNVKCASHFGQLCGSVETCFSQHGRVHAQPQPLPLPISAELLRGGRQHAAGA